MKIREFLNLSLLKNFKILAAESCIDRTFTGVTTDVLSLNAPDFLAIYRELDEGETWLDQLRRAADFGAAGILLLGRNRSDFDLSPEETTWCEDHHLPVIWIPFDNVTLFITRLKPFFREEYSHAQSSENWLYDLCHKNISDIDDSIAQKNGYNSSCHYYCLMLKLPTSSSKERHTSERALIKAVDFLNWQFSSNSTEVLHFTKPDTLIAFLPFAKGTPSSEAESKIIGAVKNIREKVSLPWEAYGGSRAKNLNEFCISFQNAVRTAQISGRFGMCKDIDFYSEWQLIALVLNAPETEISAYVEQWLGPILDKEDLMDTLSLYILHRESLKETAAEMFIHLNTLKYRLEKIGELLACDLHNQSTLVSLEIALIYYWYLYGMHGLTLKHSEALMTLTKRNRTLL